MIETREQYEQIAFARKQLLQGGLFELLEQISARPDYAAAAEALSSPSSLPSEQNADILSALAGQLQEIDDFINADEVGVVPVSSVVVSQLENDSRGLFWMPLETEAKTDSPNDQAVALICREIDEAIAQSLVDETWRHEAQTATQHSPHAYMRTTVAPVPYRKAGSDVSYFIVRDEFSHGTTDSSAKTGIKCYLVALSKRDTGKER